MKNKIYTLVILPFLFSCSSQLNSSQSSSNQQSNSDLAYKESKKSSKDIAKSEPIIVNFNFDSSDLTNKAKNILRAHKSLFKDSDAIIIDGHTDKFGPEVYNDYLGTLRANSVKKYLINNQNIKSGKITTKSYGETKPMVNEDNITAYRKNRRVEIRLISE